MTVFYRKYRPQKFGEMVGQEHVKKTLLGQLESGKISHGYLFSGPRGTGKTSTARILAKAVNCELYSQLPTDKIKGSKNEKQSGKDVHFGEPCGKCASCKSITEGNNLDLIEVDAASNRGIDEIRDLREKIKLSPVSSRFKVYIIDEVHMLTNEAFNALLKTLEEPPAHAIFILCTTEPNKLPETILSRLVRLRFSKANLDDLSEYVTNIAKSEGIKADREAIEAIAREADGSFRDSASILDQLAATQESISADDVRLITKASGYGQALELLGLLLQYDLKSAVELVNKLEGSVDFGKLTGDLIALLKGMLMIKIGVETEDLELPVKLIADKASLIDIKGLIRLLLIAEGEMRYYPDGEIALILTFCDFCADKKVTNSNGGADTEKLVTDTSQGFDKPEIVSRKAEELEKVEKKEIKSEIQLTEAGDIAEIEAVWSKFLEKVKSVNAHVMAVLRNSRPMAFDGKVVILEVFFRFHKDKLEEPKIMDILCGTISEVMGKNISFKIALSDRKTKAPKTVLRSDVLEVDPGELTLVAQEIFTK